MDLEEAQLRLGVVLAGHIMWLSTGALRLLRGERRHWIKARSMWPLRWYPLLVWLPLLAAVLGRPWRVPLAAPAPEAGLVVAFVAALFAASAMWSLGRSYGIGPDLFVGHRLVTSGPYRIVRHPQYAGFLAYHVGAAFALESAFLLAVTLAGIVPYTIARIVDEDRVLATGFGDAFARYRERVAALRPFP